MLQVSVLALLSMKDDLKPAGTFNSIFTPKVLLAIIGLLAGAILALIVGGVGPPG